MIKLKDLLLENDDIFIPRRIEDRQTKYNNITQKEVNTIIDDFIDKRYNMSLNLIPKEMDDNGYEYGTMQHDGEFVIPDKLKIVCFNVLKYSPQLGIKNGLYIANSGRFSCCIYLSSVIYLKSSLA